MSKVVGTKVAIALCLCTGLLLSIITVPVLANQPTKTADDVLIELIPFRTFMVSEPEDCEWGSGLLDCVYEYEDIEEAAPLYIRNGDSIELDLETYTHAFINSTSTSDNVELYIPQDENETDFCYRMLYGPDGSARKQEGEGTAITLESDDSWGGVIWQGSGVHEVDIYAWCPPDVSLKAPGLLDKLLSLVTIKVALAHWFNEEFVDTFEFTVVDSNSQPECCSSIIFIPGIKGSVLEREGAFGVRDVLWPPSLNPTSFSDDIEQLALTSASESVNDVRVNGLMETFYGVSIYDGFADFADDLVSQELINEWQTLPYDWRLSIDETIDNGVKNIDGSVTDWVAEVERIAAASKSKKVTIVTHSMGGLMGKALIKKLEELNKAHLVESFVLVGSPELGTPQAIASILHGDNEGIPGGYATTLGLDFLVPADSVRALSQNMPSAYNLLPSSMYHDMVDDSVATFSTASFAESWVNCWGDSIDTYDEQMEFLSAQCAPRSTPGAGQLRLPEVLSASLLADAEEIHSEIDVYIPPSNVRVVKVVGWGLPTVKSVKYLRQHLLQDYDVEFVREGDGTVVYASSPPGTGEIYYLNLDEYKETTRTFSHRDLLSAQSVQTIIEKVLNNSDIENIASIYVDKPEATQLEDMLKLSTHSPVLLGVYDTQGNFTGIDPDQELDSTLPKIIENIPGSTFIVVGENQHVFLPKGDNYRFVYQGTGNGSTTVEIAEFTGNDVTVTKTYTDIPTTPDTIATIDMSDNTEQVQVELDSDGDGEVDQTILPDGEDTEEPKTFTELISELKEYITVNVTHKSTRNKLLKQLDSIAKKYKQLEKLKSKNPLLSKIFNNNYILKFQLRALERQVGVYHRIKRLSDEVKSEVINMLRQIENVI